MTSKSPDMVAAQLASKSLDMVVISMASNNPDTVSVRQVCSRHGYYLAGVLNKKCYLWLTFSNFIKIRKGSPEITNKVYVRPKRCHL